TLYCLLIGTPVLSWRDGRAAGHYRACVANVPGAGGWGRATHLGGTAAGPGSTQRLARAGCPAVHTGGNGRYCFTAFLLGCNPAILGRERPYCWGWAGREACYMAALAGKSCTASFVSDNERAPDTMRTGGDW